MNKRFPLSKFSVTALFGFALLLCVHAPACTGQTEDNDDPEKMESRFFTNVIARTFASDTCLRSGEGYYSADGTKMIFQSERDPENPFYQIYLMDFENADIHKISPGHGKTTCAWIHPSGNLVMFASTQDDPQAIQKQRDKIKQREEGKDSRYSWDYDENYEIYSYDLSTKQYKKLTDAVGYDAEGSYSPDGKKSPLLRIAVPTWKVNSARPSASSLSFTRPL